MPTGSRVITHTPLISYDGWSQTEQFVSLPVAFEPCPSTLADIEMEGCSGRPGQGYGHRGRRKIRMKRVDSERLRLQQEIVVRSEERTQPETHLLIFTQAL